MSYLFKLPTLQVYSGETSYVFVNPHQVCALEPEEIDIGDDRSTKTVKGTRVILAQEIYFVPLTLVEVADKLQFDMLGQEKEASR